MSDYQVTPSVLESNADRLTELNARFKGSIESLTNSENQILLMTGTNRKGENDHDRNN